MVGDVTLLTADDWTTFLRAYSAEVLRDLDDDPEAYSTVTDEQRERRWLGFERAGDAEIASLATRLGQELPPSYRAFLAVSNGWTEIDEFVTQLYPVSGVGWFRDVEADLVGSWADAGLPGIDALLRRVVAIGHGEDGDHWMLDPTQVDSDGEWAAYSWHPSDGEPPHREESFAALVLDARESR